MSAERASKVPTRRRGERGAVLPLVAMLLGVLVTSVSFSVDLGRLTSRKRAVQSVVDLVAIDAARVLDGQSAVVLYPLAEAAARESALRNNYVTDATDTLSVELGTWDWRQRLFTPLGSTSLASPNAVHIGGSSDVPFMFSTYTFKAARGATAARMIRGSIPGPDSSSCAPGDPTCPTPPPACPAGSPGCPPPGPVCPPGDPTCPPSSVNCSPGGVACPFGAIAAFSVGSSLVGFQGEVTTPMFIQQKVDYLNTLLPAEVKTPTTKWNVTLVGYQGLAAAGVTLDQLRVAGTFASVDQMLNASVTYGQLMTLTLAALSNQPGGGASASAISALTVAATASSTQHFKIGDLLKVQQGMGGSAASVAVNVADLVIQGAGLSAAIELANGGSAISVPVATAIPGVVTSTLKLAFIQPPVIAIGPAGRNASGAWLTRAHTSQVRGELDTVYTLQSPVPPNPLTGSPGYSQVSIPVVLDGGDATGVLKSVLCMPLDNDTVTGIGVDTSALNAYIGNAASLSGPTLSVNDATLVNQLLFTITGKSTVAVPGVSGNLSFLGPYDQLNRQHVGLGHPVVGVGTQLDAALHTNPVSSEAGMKGALLPYLLLLDDNVIKPLESALGLEVGGANVTAFRVDCGAPVLVT